MAGENQQITSTDIGTVDTTPKATEPRQRHRDIRYSTDPGKKACPSCDGHGKTAKLTQSVAWPDAMGDALPDFTGAVERAPCSTCSGSGYVDYTPQELAARKTSDRNTGVQLTEADEMAAKRDNERLEKERAQAAAAQQATQPPQEETNPPGVVG